MISFFALRPNRLRAVEALPHGAELRLWQPEHDSFPPPGPMRRRNAAWWLLTRIGVLDRRNFSELTMWIDGRMVQRLIVTPRWWRFPFMSAHDLQIGDVWTAPEWRGRGLARAGMAEAEHLASGSAQRLWYVTDAANQPSVRLAETCGFTLVGTGTRTAPFGIHAAGRFHLTDISLSAARSSPGGSRRTDLQRDRWPAG